MSSRSVRTSRSKMVIHFPTSSGRWRRFRPLRGVPNVRPPAGHVIFGIGDFAILYLQAVHELKHRPFAGLRHVQLKLADSEQEKAAEGMGGDH